jgi:membrane-bound lytic murein transglycosylase B
VLAAEWAPLAARLVFDGFSESRVSELFARPEVRFDPSTMGKKIRTLYTKKYGSQLVRMIQVRLALLGYEPGKADGRMGSKTRRAIRWFQKAQELPVDGNPSEDLLRLALEEQKKAPLDIQVPPPRPRPIIYKTIMTPQRLGEAKAFYDAHGPLLLDLERIYGVPPEIAVGILTVETRVGGYLGEDSAFITLASMALCTDFSLIASYFADEILTKRKRRWLKRRTARKAEWAYKECKALLTYAQANRQDPLTIPGSFYGAIGISQFMPTKVLKYGVDGNGDGVVDMFVLEDALFSMANYLQEHGWKGPMKSRWRQRRIILRYNYSKPYVNTVMAVADYLRATGK